jgi:hypothetical protein
MPCTGPQQREGAAGSRLCARRRRRRGRGKTHRASACSRIRTVSVGLIAVKYVGGRRIGGLVPYPHCVPKCIFIHIIRHSVRYRFCVCVLVRLPLRRTPPNLGGHDANARRSKTTTYMRMICPTKRIRDSATRRHAQQQAVAPAQGATGIRGRWRSTGDTSSASRDAHALLLTDTSPIRQCRRRVCR